MRDYSVELKNRVEFIRNLLKESHADGIIFGNSGGKDSALCGIICKMACENTIGVIMPCSSKRNFSLDKDDGIAVAKKFDIKTEIIDVTSIRDELKNKVSEKVEINPLTLSNIAPRIRMATLYAIAGSKNLLVCGTGNRTEMYLGYYTKWGDGACDFNPISDLTVGEVYEFLHYLGCPECIINKAPSAALYEGQTDEDDMGMKYSDIDSFITSGNAPDFVKEKATKMHLRSEHKRIGVRHYKNV